MNSGNDTAYSCRDHECYLIGPAQRVVKVDHVQKQEAD